MGLFVFSSGLVAGPRLKDPSSKRSLWQTVKLVLPALLLGVSRAYLTKAVDYQVYLIDQEHVTEYGVHWNFFITLGSLPLLVYVQNKLFPKIPLILIAIVSIAGYQYYLLHGLEQYILNAPRIDWLSMNREGVFSLIGFYCIFLIAGELGADILSMVSKTHASEVLETRNRTLLTYLSIISYFLYLFVFEIGWQVSRRMVLFF